MALPPLPEGSVSTTLELPPLPEGATTHDIIPIAEYIPTDVEVGKPTAIEHDVWDKIAIGLSSGKYGSWKDLFHGGEKPEDSYLKELSQIIESSGIQGLPGTGPVGNTTLKGSKLASKASEYVPEAIPQILTKIKEATAPVAEKIGKVASNVGNKIGDVSANFLASRSRLDPKDVKDAYTLGKEGEESIMKAFREHQNIDFPLDSIANYNYAMSLGVPSNVARMSTHYNKQLETGAHMLKNLWENQIPEGLNISPEKFQILRQELLSKLEKLSSKQAEAEILGIKTGDLIQSGKRGMQNTIAESLGFGGLGTLASHYLLHTLAPGVSLAALPLITKSPKVAAELAIKAGQANKYIPLILKSLPTAQTLGAIGSANEYLNSEE
jgi:hypothetical protein